MSDHRATLHCPCKGGHFSTFFAYNRPPKGEIRFRFSATESYYRELQKCQFCGHFISVHKMDMSQLYSEDYVSSNYGESGLLASFNRINALPVEKSDNVGRVNRIIQYAAQYFPREKDQGQRRTVLDVGSGLCVFLYRMKAAGWDCTAIDPDERAAKHAHEVVGVNVVCGDFMSAEIPGQFDLITFNKVLEHVEDPVLMLQKSHSHLAADGFVYVEVPDGECAAVAGKEREEFFIDHHHVFSLTSLTLLAERAGFVLQLAERLQEPSTKYTLRA
ncbi:MAG: class I SAM-dependent methyltransferase, partial [bacterium]